MLLVLSMSLVLTACDFGKDPGGENPGGNTGGTTGGDTQGGDTPGGEDPDDPTPPPPPPPPPPEEEDKPLIFEAYDVLQQMLTGIGATAGEEKKLNFEMVADIDTKTDGKYEFSVKTNVVGFLAENLPMGENELAIVLKDVTDNNEENQPIKFAFYIINEKPFLQLEGYPHLIYLSDFNMNYMLQILKNAPPELVKLLDPLLSGIGFTVESIIKFVIGLLCDDAMIVSEGNVTNLSFDIEIKNFISAIAGLVGGLSLPIDIKLAPLFDTINELVPNVKVAVGAKLVDGALAQEEDAFSIKVINKSLPESDPNSETFSLTASMKLTEQKVDIGLPTITEADMTVFSFTNMAFDIDFLLNSADSTGSPKQVDIGALVNTFMSLDPNNKTKLPENMLMLTVDMGFRLSIKLDLDLNYMNEPVDKNLIAIELFLINKDHQKIDPTPQLGLYYQNGAAYVNLGNLIPNYYKSKNIRLDINLDAAISLLVDKLATAIDNALKTDFDSAINPSKPVDPNAPAIMNVVTLTADEEGQPVVKPGYVMFVDAIAQMFGIEKHIKTDNLVSGTQNPYLEIVANNDLLATFEKVLQTQIPFRFPSNMSDIRLYVGDTVVPDIGTPEYDIYNDTGKKQFGVTGAVSIGGVNLELQVRNFNMFFQNMDLEEYVTNAIGDKTTYTNSIAAVLDDVLANFHFQVNLKMQFKKGTYDLVPFLMGVGGDALKILEGQHLLWTFDSDFLLDADLIIQIALDKSNHANSSLVVELKTNQAIRIGTTELFPEDSVILGLYGYNNAIYADLSNIKIAKITLPKLKADLDFTALVYKFIGDFDFKLAFDLTTLFGSKDPNEPAPSPTSVDMEAQQQALDQMFVDGDSQGELTPVGQIIVGVNANALTVSTTLAAVLQLINEINKANGNSEAISVDFIKDMSLDLIASRLDGLKIDLKAELVPRVELDINGKPKVDATGNVIYNYDSGLAVHLETGTNKAPLRIGNLDELKIDLAKRAAEFENYEADLVQAIISTVGKAKFAAKVNLKTVEEKFNLTAIINNFLTASGTELGLPINLHLDDWDTAVDLVIAWNLDLENFYNSQLQVKFSYLDKTLLEVDILDGSIVIDLTGLGFFKFELTNAPFVELINNALKGVVAELGKLNLSDILDQALGDITLGGALGNNVIGSGSANADTKDTSTDGAMQDAEEAGLDQATMDLIAILINGIKAENATLFIKLDALMLDKIFSQLLGFGLGLNIDLDAKFDIVNGEIDLKIGVESMEVGVNFKMLVGETIDLVEEGVDLNRIPDWDCTNGTTLAQSMLDNLDICLALDYRLTNKDIEKNVQANGDDARAEADQVNGRMVYSYYTRIIIEKLHSNKTLAGTGGKRASKGSLLVSLGGINKDKYNNSNGLDGAGFSPMVYIEINYNAKVLNVSLAKGLITLGSLIDFADLINISVPLDLITTLANAFDPLLESIRQQNEQFGIDAPDVPVDPQADQGGTTGETTPETPAKPLTRMDKTFAKLDIMQLLSGGIDIYLRNTGLFNVNVTFDPFTLNWIIDEVLSSVFGPDTILDLSEITKTYDENGNVTQQILHSNYLSYVNWDRIDAEHTWFSLRDQLKPLAKDAVSSLGYGALAPLITDAILGGFYFQIRRIFSRLLPFPVFNEFKAGINVMDGTFANVYILGYDHDENVYLPEGKTVHLWDPDAKEHKSRVAGKDEIYTYTQRTNNDNTTDDVIGQKQLYTRQYAASSMPNTDKGTYKNYERSRDTAYCTEIWLYNCSPAVGTPDYSIDGNTEGVMTWGDIDASPKFDPYMYKSIATEKDGKTVYQTDPSAKSTFIAKEFSNKEVKYQRGSKLLKTTPTYSCVAKKDFNDNILEKYDTAKRLDEINFNDPGIYEVIATAKFSDGTIRTFTINLTIYGFDEIASVGEYDLYNEYRDEVQLHAYSQLPKILVIKYDKPDVRGENYRRIAVEDSMFSDFAPQGIHDHTVTAKIKLPSNITKDVKLHYLDSKIAEIKGGMNVPVDLYQFTATTVEALNDYAPNMLYFQYADGSSDKMPVNGDWDMTQAKELVNRENTNLKGGMYAISNSIGTGLIQQPINVNFLVKSREVDSIEVNGQQNIVRISPYQFYMYNVSDLIPNADGTMPTAKDESLNPFPTTVQATYTETLGADGQPLLDVNGNPIPNMGMYTEDVIVKPWKFDGKLDWDNDNQIQKDPQGNIVKNTTLTLDTDKTIPNAPGVTTPEQKVYNTRFTWDYKLNVTLDRNEVQQIFFDEELTQNTLVIDPYKYSILRDAIFPTVAWIKFTNGQVMKMPIAWVEEELDTFDKTFGFEVQNRQFRVYIGYDLKAYSNHRLPKTATVENGGLLATADFANTLTGVQGRFLQKIVVNARVEGLVAKGIDIKGSELNPDTIFAIDPVVSKYLGQSPFPTEVDVVYTTGETAKLPVNWTYDEEAIKDINGIEQFTARATIQGTEIGFDIKCIVLNRRDPIVIDDTREINPYDCTFDESGNRVYKEYTKTLQVKYFTSYVVNVTEIETQKTFQVVDLYTTKMLNDTINFYKSGENEGKYIVERAEDIYTTYDIPVEWEKNINYRAPLDAGKDILTAVKATFVGATDSVETVNIALTILYKKIVNIGDAEDYTFYVVKGGINLSDKEASSKKVVREMYVTFSDGSKKPDGALDPAGMTTVKTQVTFDLSNVDFDIPTYDYEKSEALPGMKPTKVQAYIMIGTDIVQTIEINVHVTTKPVVELAPENGTEQITPEVKTQGGSVR